MLERFLELIPLVEFIVFLILVVIIVLLVSLLRSSFLSRCIVVQVAHSRLSGRSEVFQIGGGNLRGIGEIELGERSEFIRVVVLSC